MIKNTLNTVFVFKYIKRVCLVLVVLLFSCEMKEIEEGSLSFYEEVPLVDFYFMQPQLFQNQPNPINISYKRPSSCHQFEAVTFERMEDEEVAPGSQAMVRTFLLSVVNQVIDQDGCSSENHEMVNVVDSIYISASTEVPEIPFVKIKYWNGDMLNDNERLYLEQLILVN